VMAMPPGRAMDGAVVVAKIRDITSQRQEAQALKAAEQTFRDLFERAPNGVSITRARDGLVIEANEAWCRLFGLTREEAIGHTLYDLGIWLKPEDRQTLLESLNQGQVIHAWPFSTRRRDGTGLEVGLGLAEVTLNGEDCLLAVLQDHSELRQVETDQRKLEKAESLGLMAAGISHDFNNLFQSLLTSLELAHSRSDHAGRHFLDRAMTSLERASNVSRRLMEFSGGSFTHPEAVSMNTLIEEVAATQTAQGAGVRLHLSLAEELPLVSVDRKQLCRVLEVLMENAVEAMGSQPGSVTLGSELLPGLQAEERQSGHWAVDAPDGPLVRVSVRDSAGGVDRSLLGQLFDPYFSTKAPGRGLGLSAASGLLRGNRAGLQVVNQPGEGLTVHIYLPAAAKG
jgi:two-component system, cell cycle sensor histidine kinase and response regulator CckA